MLGLSSDVFYGGDLLRPASKGVLIAACVFCIVALSHAQKAGQSKMTAAMSYFDSAKYDEAIGLLSELAADTTVSKPDRREVMLRLGRSYLAKRLNDKAKDAITKLLALEPPVVTLDPDTECPNLLRMYYEARKSKSGTNAIERPDPGIKTIAILDFSNRSLDDKARFDPMEKGFAELMINQLKGSVNLKVVERERIQWILDEIALENNPGKFDVGSAVRVGKQLGVNSILLGSFIKFKDQIKILSRLVKVETSEILATDEMTGDVDKFFDLTEKLGIQVAKKINVAITQAEVSKGTETKSLDAMMTYSEGLVELEKGNYKGAFEKFMKALSLDPQYEKARKKADSLKPLLG